MTHDATDERSTMTTLNDAPDSGIAAPDAECQADVNRIHVIATAYVAGDVPVADIDAALQARAETPRSSDGQQAALDRWLRQQPKTDERNAMTTAPQIATATKVIETMLARTDPALHGLALTSAPITTELEWETFDITLHATVGGTTDDMSYRASIDEDGVIVAWKGKRYPAERYDDAPLPHALSEHSAAGPSPDAAATTEASDDDLALLERIWFDVYQGDIRANAGEDDAHLRWLWMQGFYGIESATSETPTRRQLADTVAAGLARIIFGSDDI